MNAFIQDTLHPNVLIYSILLILVLLYWITVLIGALDLDFLDVEFDTDAEVDVDIDAGGEVDTDSEVSTEGGGMGWIMSTLSFFNLGKVPFMIFLSALIISLWTYAMLTHTLFPQSHQWSFFLTLVPFLFLGLFTTKIITLPLKGIHKQLNQTGTRKKELVGKMATVKLNIQPGRKGQIELDHNDQHFLLTVSSDADIALEKGSKVIIVEYDDTKDHYLVSPFDV